jgi:hypothetical protein
MNVWTLRRNTGAAEQIRLGADHVLRPIFRETAVANDARYKEYSRETAICVELALNTVEEDIQTELQSAAGTTVDALRRVLEKMRERRKVLERFTQAA